jgi:predicted metal-binding membrane protein
MDQDMTEERAAFDHLDRPGRLTAFMALKPRAVVNTVVAAAVLLSWIVLASLAIEAAQVGLPAEGTPGDRLLRLLPELPLPDWAGRFVSLCATPANLGTVPGSFLVLWSMWSLMAVAMMLPSAAPMIRTYCEIAETAEAKGEPVVHPLVLVAGYLVVWIAAAVAFAGPSFVIQTNAGALAKFAAPAALGIAGLYQFSRLKEACLKKCRHPFAILFSRWSSRPARIFRLGAEQGVWCLGCCWALMLVMFAVGVMNIFWMALVGLFTIVEKQWTGRLPTRIAGALLLVWAAALLIALR